MECELREELLRVVRLHAWPDYSGFEQALALAGPWVAGLDFPFGQARRFLENAGWPRAWAGYVTFAADLGRDGFRDALRIYRKPRPTGDKEHKRTCDRLAKSASPQKIEFPPVGLMFFEGAPRLLASGASVLGLHSGDPTRLAVESYPALVARALIGGRAYKHDTKAKQSRRACAGPPRTHGLDGFGSLGGDLRPEGSDVAGTDAATGRGRRR